MYYEVDDYNALREALHIMCERLEDRSIPEDAVFDCKLAAAELLSNILQHEGMKAYFKAELSGNTVTIKVKGDKDFRPPERTSLVGVDAENGRGLYLIDAICQSRLYDEQDGICVKVVFRSTAPSFDNFPIEALSELLSEDTAFGRFYPLIALRAQLIEQLKSFGVTDKDTFFEKLAELSEIAERSDREGETLRLLESFFHLFDFKNRNLKEVEGVDALIERLDEKKIRTAGDYLKMCVRRRMEEVCAEFGARPEEVARLFGVCDLMRLPKMRGLRAGLYYDMGLKNIKTFARQNRDDLKRKYVSAVGERGNYPVPLDREINTQIAFARVLPPICFSK